MSLVIKGQFGLIVDAVREKRPVIHHLTNYVTAGDCANITLCAGASPVMADEAEEVAEITSNADALVLNLGTIAKDIDNERCFFIKGDICSRDVVDGLFAEYRFDYVVNFAAESHVDRSLSLIHI